METINLLTQFVEDNPNCEHVNTVPYGVAFRYRGHDCKFSLVLAPMFAIEPGQVALIVANTYMGPKSLLKLPLNHPELFQKITAMLDYIADIMNSDKKITSLEDIASWPII